MTKVNKETFAKALKVIEKPLNVEIDIHLCTNFNPSIKHSVILAL